jgi:hypothetical protein
MRYGIDIFFLIDGIDILKSGSQIFCFHSTPESSSSSNPGLISSAGAVRILVLRTLKVSNESVVCVAVTTRSHGKIIKDNRSS